MVSSTRARVSPRIAITALRHHRASRAYCRCDANCVSHRSIYNSTAWPPPAVSSARLPDRLTLSPAQRKTARQYVRFEVPALIMGRFL